MSGEIHIWTFLLDVPPDEGQRLASALSPDERARTLRFAHMRDGRRFAVGRARLRQVLGAILNCLPADVCFEYGPHGKPVNRDLLSRGVYFNLSHSRNVAMIAVAFGVEIGIDVEEIRADFATDEIAQRFFSPAEWGALRHIALELRTEAFFRCWARKEAFIKALGQGLAYPLDSFDVPVDPGESARVLRTALVGEWSLQDVPAPSGFVAALAAAGPIRRIVQRDE